MTKHDTPWKYLAVEFAGEIGFGIADKDGNELVDSPWVKDKQVIVTIVEAVNSHDALKQERDELREVLLKTIPILKSQVQWWGEMNEITQREEAKILLVQAELMVISEEPE